MCCNHLCFPRSTACERLQFAAGSAASPGPNPAHRLFREHSFGESFAPRSRLRLHCTSLRDGAGGTDGAWTARDTGVGTGGPRRMAAPPDNVLEGAVFCVCAVQCGGHRGSFPASRPQPGLAASSVISGDGHKGE